MTTYLGLYWLYLISQKKTWAEFPLTWWSLENCCDCLVHFLTPIVRAISQRPQLQITFDPLLDESLHSNITITCWKSKRNSYVDPMLRNPQTTHVFVRQDAHVPPLHPAYKEPLQNFAQKQKVLFVGLHNTH